MRRFHRWFGLISAGFILLTVVTGLMWAYAPHFYWEAGYKERKSETPAPPISAATIGIADVVSRVPGDLRAVALRRDFGRLVYEARPSGDAPAVLIDGVSGEVLSPLSEPLAAQAARQYVPDAFTLEGVDMLDVFRSRDGITHGPTAVARFAEGGGTEIFIDRMTGHLIEDQDRMRRFHFWIMRLHKLSFLGFKKELTIIPGLSILTMLLSGLLIFRRIRARRVSD